MEKVGTKIRTERRARHLSLKELAKRCGLSTGTLQRIETGKTSPSVAVLAQIASYLLQPIDYFIQDERPKFRILRKGEHQVISSPKLALTMIAPMGLIDSNTFVNIGETKEGHFIDSHTEEGYSFVYMLEGGCIIEHDGFEYELHEGDSLFYDASYPHSVTAIGETAHRFISIFFKGKK